MSVLIDSANLDDVRHAASLGFIRGVTTNPTLMKRETDDPLRHAEMLLNAGDLAELFYQPTGAYGPLQHEAETAWSLDRDRVILKLPATSDGASVAAAMVRRGARVALTAAQTPQAMIVAESIGCVAVIPYLDRALRDTRVPTDLIRALARVRRGRTRIIVASVKSVGQFVRAFQDGADAVTAPRDVCDALLTHPASTEAEQAFAAEYAEHHADHRVR